MRTSYINENSSDHIDNYEKVCETWREIYQKMDKKELAERFQLEMDDKALYIDFFSEKFRLDHESGMITSVEEPDRVLGFNTIMCIYHLFYYSKKDAKLKGDFVPYRQVKRGAPFAPAFEKTVVKPFAKVFDGHLEAFIKAGEVLEGKPIKQGDAGFILPAFENIPVMVVFWDGDDEFAAQANILFDADITDFFHEETVVCIGSEAVSRMTQASGLGKAKDLLGDEY